MASYLNFPFDEEVFSYKWQTEPDAFNDAMLKSGAIIEDAEIKKLIANGSDVYTVPYYNTLGGEEINYDGQTSFSNVTYAEGNSISGIVFGRGMKFGAKDFIKDFNSGADDGDFIASEIGKVWNKKRLARIVSLLDCLLGKTGDASWATHLTNLAVTTNTATPSAANKVGATTIGDAVQKAMGDKSSQITLAIMNSAVAHALANLNLLEFRKYTDINGIERQLNIADINGKTVIVTDNGTVQTNATSEQTEYKTYLLGLGAIRTATAPVEHATSKDRDEDTNGGEDYIYTRERRTYAPYGFSYAKPNGATASVTDAQLCNAQCWTRKYDAKMIPIVGVITNG